MLHDVFDTSTTASVNKVGMDIESTGVWTGSSAVNTGLVVNATGGTTNYAATFSGGNVGIGTATPGATLQAVNSSATMQFSSTDGLGNTNTPSLQLYRTGSSGWTKLEIGANAAGSSTQTAGIWVNGGGEIRYVAASCWFPTFYSSGSEAMRISTAGNVGIGTTSPGSSLQVNGGEAVGYSTSTAAPTNGLTVSGNVGVGTATVPTGVTESINGPVKVAGTGSEGCSAATVGSMRYNPTGQYMEICTYP